MDVKHMNIAGIEPESFVDGPGIRYVIFAQGCPHRCRGCHNPQTWDPRIRNEISHEAIISDIGKHLDMIQGVTFSGGDPIYQPYDTACLILDIKEKYPELDIWVYTGYTFEDLLNDAKDGDHDIFNILNNIDMLVDGKYDEALRDLTLSFRGSSNQKLIGRSIIQERIKNLIDCSE